MTNDDDHIRPIPEPNHSNRTPTQTLGDDFPHLDYETIDSIIDQGVDYHAGADTWLAWQEDDTSLLTFLYDRRTGWMQVWDGRVRIAMFEAGAL